MYSKQKLSFFLNLFLLKYLETYLKIKIFLITIFLLLLTITFGQNKSKTVNGINLSAFGQGKKINGLSIGLVAEDSIVNGLQIGIFATNTFLTNGLTIGGFGCAGGNLNGVNIAGLSVCGDTISGLLISLFGNMWWNTDSIDVINGLSIGGIIGSYTHRLNGVSIGCFRNEIGIQNGVTISVLNKARELHGFQFGVLNYAGNNRRFFRWTPIVNFNLKKNKQTKDHS